jgi:hypothetical protein
MFSHRYPVRLAMLAAAAVAFSACSDSTSPERDEMVEPYRWTATYATAEKFGGASGRWSGRADVVVTADRRVLLGTAEIINPQVGETSISWSMADGNNTNASIQFLVESSSDYFWGEVGVAGKLFQGWIQYPGQGKLDYRGLAR